MPEKPNPLYLIPAALMTAAMLPIVPLALVLRYLNDQPPQAHFPSIRCPACGECNCDECRRLRKQSLGGSVTFRDSHIAANVEEYESWRSKIREMRERFRS